MATNCASAERRNAASAPIVVENVNDSRKSGAAKAVENSLSKDRGSYGKIMDVSNSKLSMSGRSRVNAAPKVKGWKRSSVGQLVPRPLN